MRVTHDMILIRAPGISEGVMFDLCWMRRRHQLCEELGVSSSKTSAVNLGGAGKSLGVVDTVAEGGGGVGVEVRKE